MEKTKKETSDRAKKWKCVRFDDNNGFRTKFNKTNFPNESRREMYYYSVKFVEQGMRRNSPTFVAKKKKFQKFGKVSEGLKLEPIPPEGFESLTHMKKREAVEKLIDKFEDKLAAAMSREDADKQVNNPGQTQVDGVPAAAPNPGQIQVDEVPAAAPNPALGSTLSNDTSLQNVAWNQFDNSQCQPPSRPPVPLEWIAWIMNDVMYRASMFPGISPKFEWSEEAFRSLVIQLESMEGAFQDRSVTFSRSGQMEIYAPLPDFQTANEEVPSVDAMSADEFWRNFLASPGRPETPGTSPNLYKG